MKTLILIAAALSLMGCKVEPQEVGDGEFDPNKIAYFKDRRTNVCYAVVSYSRFDTTGRMAAGMSHAAVPCSPEVERLVRGEQRS